MSKHLFGLIVTPYGAAANNRGETDGNITTLQKILWKNEVHTTVSAEAIRWALRYFWQRRNGKDSVNRRWNDETGEHEWQDQTWKPWTSNDDTERAEPTFIDDDALGFMLAEAASTDGNDAVDALKEDKKTVEAEFKKLSKDEQKDAHGKSLKERLKLINDQIKVLSQGTTDKRRGALEVTRAISLAPFAGDITFNAKSGKKTNVSLYGTELHATRYQYGIALTPESLREPKRALDVIDAVAGLSEVAGNQSRFLYDFAPDSVVFRWADDFAPRVLYGFEMDSDASLSFPAVLQKVKTGDVSADELYIGGSIVGRLSDDDKKLLHQDGKGAFLHEGVKATVEKLKGQVRKDLGV
jgi:CRISPR-associated protein Cst2